MLRKLDLQLYVFFKMSIYSCTNRSILATAKYGAYQKLYDQAAFVHWRFVDRHPFIVDTLQVAMFYHFTYGGKSSKWAAMMGQAFQATRGRAVHKRCSHGTSGRL